MDSEIKKGDFIEIDYIGRIKDSGDIFDLTDEELAKKEGMYNEDRKYGPSIIVVGAGYVIKGLDEQLEKLKIGEKEKIEVSPEGAFGLKDPKKVFLTPMKIFRKQKVTPVPGLPVEIGGQGGIVKTVSGGRVTVDFNHPLSGRTLEYEINVLRKVTSSEEQLKALFSFHLPKCDFKDMKIKIEAKIAIIELLGNGKTRRFINLTKDIISKDILRYVGEVEKIKFIETVGKEDYKIKES